MGSLRRVSGARNLARAAAQKVYARWARLPLREAVLLESFEGSDPSGDPAAIAEHLQERTDLPLVWAVREPLPDVGPRVRSVRYRSAAYFKALATSKYLINNVTFPALFQKRDDQVYLNTWHGTPLKKMGRDVDAAYAHIANTQENLAAADMLLSSGSYMTDTMYVGAYGVQPESVVELGSPRVDVQFQVQAEPDLVLYAPTWQEESPTRAVDDLDAVADRIEGIAIAAHPGTRVLVRVHGKLRDRTSGHSRLAPFLAPPEISTNTLLARTATLITDFSSVAFDYLATGREVLFFTPVDYPRGVYLSDAELPGPRTDSLATLQTWLSDGAPGADVGIEAARARFCPHEDGNATARVVDTLLSR